MTDPSAIPLGTGPTGFLDCGDPRDACAGCRIEAALSGKGH
jgi:hypothetical protein